jgi:hypothetical protein
MKTITFSQHEELKRAAKRLKKELGISHSEALERLAKEAGFNNYHHLTQVIENPRPYRGTFSSADASYEKISLKSGEIWFALDVNDSEKYDHSTFPKQWGIKEDEGKLSAITDDFVKQFPDQDNDRSHPGQKFYWDHKVFKLKIKNAKTLLDVCKYIREVFFWEPIYVFQKDMAYIIEIPKAVSYKDWLRR